MTVHRCCVPTAVGPDGGAHHRWPIVLVAIGMVAVATVGAAACTATGSPPIPSQGASSTTPATSSAEAPAVPVGPQQQPEQSAAPAPPATPGGGLPAVTVPPLPIEPYIFTPVQGFRLNAARFRLAAHCMQSYGLAFTAPLPLPV